MDSQLSTGKKKDYSQVRYAVRYLGHNPITLKMLGATSQFGTT